MCDTLSNDTSSNEPFRLKITSSKWHFVDWAHCRKMVSSNNEKISWLFASKPVAMLHVAFLIMCSSHDFEVWTTITKCIPFCAFTIFWNIIFIHYSSLNEYLRQFPQSHDEHMTQTVSNMASAISFGIRNHGKYFDEVTYSTKLHSTKWRFDEVTIQRKLSTKCRSRRSVVRRSVSPQNTRLISVFTVC